MKQLIFISIFSIVAGEVMAQNCTTVYSYTESSDTVTFDNESVIPNAYYYWNFGDGSGSRGHSPVHVFPDDGMYLVTLYGLDTITRCSNYSEQWITIEKQDTLAPCELIYDSYIQGNGIVTSNQSAGCSGYNFSCDAGPGMNSCGGTGLGNWYTALFLSRLQLSTNDSIYGYRYHKEYYKTIPYNFSREINYQDCSPNFEIDIDLQPTNAIVTLTSMSPTGIDSFWVTGFGNPIVLIGHSVSYVEPYYANERYWPRNISHSNTDVSNGCWARTTQQILTKNPNYTFPTSCEIYEQPQSQTSAAGSEVYFFIETGPNVAKQWQQDAGLGFVNLTEAGPYSGVNSDTLTISNVQLTMNNYRYRCKLSNEEGWGCYNTSAQISLDVTTGVEQIVESIGVVAIPNPFSQQLTLVLENPQRTPYSYRLITPTGQVVKTETNVTSEHLRVDRGNLASGIYFYQFWMNGRLVAVGKVVAD